MSPLGLAVDAAESGNDGGGDDTLSGDGGEALQVIDALELVQDHHLGPEGVHAGG